LGLILRNDSSLIDGIIFLPRSNDEWTERTNDNHDGSVYKVSFIDLLFFMILLLFDYANSCILYCLILFYLSGFSVFDLNYIYDFVAIVVCFIYISFRLCSLFVLLICMFS